MKYPVKLSALLLAAELVLNSAWAEPVFQQRFHDDASDIELLNGAVIGGPGSGVSGKPEDRAYTAPVIEEGDDLPPPAGVIPNVPYSGLTNYTVTIWYKSEREIRDPDTLFHLGGLYLLWDKRTGFTMRLQKWIGTGMNGPILPWHTTHEWVFYAFTWNHESKMATIYQGTSTDAVAFHFEREVTEITEENGIEGNCIIGNDWKGSGPHSRPFSGSIDNLQIFDSTLSLDEIETIRAADVAHASP